MKTKITDRIEYLVSTFLNEGLNVEEEYEFKKLLKDKDIHTYFRECYIIWHESFQVNDIKKSDEAFKKIWDTIDNQKYHRKKIFSTIKFNPKNIFIVIAASIITFICGMGTHYLISFKSEEIKSTIYAKNKISVPLGAKSQVELPDGTIVILNAGSRLEYDLKYGQNAREVWLEGEGYFKVAKDEKTAFLVNANKVLIKALGTEFNVKAYADEEFVQTTLVEGSVSINPMVEKGNNSKNIVLQPNQMLTIHKDRIETEDKNISELSTDSQKTNNIDINTLVNKSKISTETVNTILYTSWKDSRWIIEEESMENLAQKLQRRYDINIQINDETLKNYKFSGILEDETLEQVLEIMKTIAPIEYTINKKQVSIDINQRQKKSFEDSMNS